MYFKEGLVLKLSTQDVEYVAKLARLEVSEQEKEKFTAQLNDILLYICLLYPSPSPRDRG